LDLSFYAAPNFEKGTAAKELREDKKETADSFSAGGRLLLWPCSTKAYLSGFYEIVFRTVYGTIENHLFPWFSSPWVSRKLMGTRLKPCPSFRAAFPSAF
jgi:hypothetical protein